MVSIQTDLINQTRSLYDRDFVGWTEQVAEALRRGDWAALDVANLIEEVEALGKSDRRAIKSRLEVLLMHLLSSAVAVGRRRFWNSGCELRKFWKIVPV
jgi:hypothetical protein